MSVRTQIQIQLQLFVVYLPAFVQIDHGEPLVAMVRGQGVGSRAVMPGYSRGPSRGPQSAWVCPGMAPGLREISRKVLLLKFPFLLLRIRPVSFAFLCVADLCRLPGPSSVVTSARLLLFRALFVSFEFSSVCCVCELPRKNSHIARVSSYGAGSERRA